MRSAGLDPVKTPVTLLELLRTPSKTRFGGRVKEALVQYGITVTLYQRQLRVYNVLMSQEIMQQEKRDYRSLQEELAFADHTSWSALEYPDWLLLEIESNLIIRPTQVDVAKATIAPKSEDNSVLQMNMGEGRR